ncbi:MAG: multidrug ABC transporter permease [Rickettsiales bacterium]|nr:multidrug ABC transporter permease [Rickettsiales bacterium]OUV79465.1 MAG: hypothetical protein CBC91_03605 [Rickettsiales bacterium TMED131]|tara:strand:- start:1972 stop:2754 length:783 start_codon:yes stop_codon:yes gene_type:complete
MQNSKKIKMVNWVGMYTLLLKETKRFCKVYQQTILAPAFTSLLFFLVISIAIGSKVDYQFNYINFLAPGLVIMTMMQNAFANTSSSILGSKMQGNIVDLLMPPLNPNEIIISYISAALIRSILVGLITYLVIFPFTSLVLNNFIIIIIYSLLGSIFLALLGLMAGIWSEKFDNMSGITNFIITPLTFLSGTFYTIDRLPEPFYTISLFNPFYYIIDGFRQGFQREVSYDLAYGITYLSMLNLLIYLVSYRILKKGWMLKP